MIAQTIDILALFASLRRAEGTGVLGFDENGLVNQEGLRGLAARVAGVEAFTGIGNTGLVDDVAAIRTTRLWGRPGQATRTWTASITATPAAAVPLTPGGAFSVVDTVMGKALRIVGAAYARPIAPIFLDDTQVEEVKFTLKRGLNGNAADNVPVLELRCVKPDGSDNGSVALPAEALTEAGGFKTFTFRASLVAGQGTVDFPANTRAFYPLAGGRGPGSFDLVLVTHSTKDQTASTLDALSRFTSAYRPADLLASWTSQISLPDTAAAPLTEGPQIAVVPGSDGRVLRVTPSTGIGLGPIQCETISLDKTYEFRLPAKRIEDGSSPTALIRLYGFTGANGDAGNANILAADFLKAEPWKEAIARLTGAQIKSLMPNAVKFRRYVSLSAANGIIEISDLSRSVVSDTAAAVVAAQSTAVVPANGRFPYADPSDTSGNPLRSVDFSVLQALLGGASAGTIATLSAVLGTKLSRYAPREVINLVKPYIEGNTGAGQIQTLNMGKWLGADDFMTLWMVDGQAVPAGTGLTYTRTAETATSKLSNRVVGRSGRTLTEVVARTTEAVPAGATQAVPVVFESVAGLGDSITVAQGVTNPAVNSWLAKWGAYYGATKVLNQGRSGTVLQNSPDKDGSPMSGNGRDRYLADVLGSNKCTAIAPAYGFNDGRYTSNPGEFNVLAYVNDYREIVAGLIAGGYPRNLIFIVTPHYILDVGLQSSTSGFFSGQTRANFLAFVEASKQIALEFGTYWADSYSMLKAAVERGENVIGGDNIHPNNLGHEYIYQALLAARKFADPEPHTTPAILDYFVGEDGQTILRHAPELGMAWERQPGYAPTIDAQLVNGRLFNPANNAVYRNLADMRGADCFVEVDLTFISNAAANVGVIGRAHAALNQFYFANYNRNTSEFGLWKVVDGVGTTQLGSYIDPFASGARTMRLSMAGTAISVQVDGQTRIGVSDSSIAGPGFCGIRFGTIGSKTGGIHISRFQTGSSKTVVEDEFSGANGASIVGYSPPIGGQYQNQTGFAPASPPVFINGRLRSAAGATLMRNLAAPSSPDYYVEATFDFIGVRSDDIGVIGRASATAETLYFVRWRLGEWSLWRDVNGSQASLASSADAFDSGSRTVRLLMKGTSISVRVDGLTIISIEDATVAGPGFGGFRIGAAQTDTTGRHLTRLVVAAL